MSSLVKPPARPYTAAVLEAPLYQEVKQALTRDLAGGEWRPGEALPSEAALAKRFRVSIGTVRKAVDALVAEHAVVRQQGRGTFVATHDPRRLLFHFFHIVPREGGSAYPDTRLLAFARSRATPSEAARLGLAAAIDYAMEVGLDAIYARVRMLADAFRKQLDAIPSVKTRDLGAITRTGDVVIVAVGRPNFVTGDMLRLGAVVVDVGINVVDGKLVGETPQAGATEQGLGLMMAGMPGGAA